MPAVTLKDESGRSRGEAIAWIEFGEGPLAGGCLLYVCHSLLEMSELRTELLADLLRSLLQRTESPPARALRYRTLKPPEIDGRLDGPIWPAASWSVPPGGPHAGRTSKGN